MARWYANEHFKTDPGIEAVYFLPSNSDDREIRLVEVNNLIADRTNESLEAIDFGVDRGMDSEHSLSVLDVTPAQWEQLRAGDASLPAGWSLEGQIRYEPR